jgi:hypothetical protein
MSDDRRSPTSERAELERKLCRELSQSEHSAIVHPRREARRLGDTPPGDALRAISAHAQAMRPRLDALLEKRSTPGGVRIGQLVGELFSRARQFVGDRLIDTERSYRGTLLGLDHGADIVRLLAAIADHDGDARLAAFCAEWLEQRLALIDRARRELEWFAREPRAALVSGFRRTLAAPR